jgi:small multidrug resistance family-3 protein
LTRETIWIRWLGTHPWSQTIVEFLKTLALFLATAVAEIVGCYLPYLWLKHGRPAWVLIPAALSLAAFVWLLSLHPHAAGRVYAAYGGVYVATALIWLWAVDAIRPTATDLVGAAICIAGMGVIMFGSRPV